CHPSLVTCSLMNKENVLFSLVGVGFGLFLGFSFVVWANQRAAASAARATASNAGAESGANGSAENQSSITVAERQQLDSQLEEVAKRARENQSDFDAQKEAGQLHYQAQLYDDALEFLLRANKLRTDDVETVVLLGNANYDAGRYEMAERWYTAALTKKPDDVNVRTDLGLTFLLREPSNPDRAITEFRRSLERDPAHIQTWQNLTVALTRKKEKREAQEALARLEKLAPDNPALPKLRAEIEAISASPAGVRESSRR
ncbi:MAG: tetratricopeptide repeat protein, partial [Pyrinomonadaceae bacterium]